MTRETVSVVYCLAKVHYHNINIYAMKLCERPQIMYDKQSQNTDIF